MPDRRPVAPRDPLKRILWLKIGLLAFFAVVTLRLLQVQVLNAGKYRELARRQYEAKVPLPALRGTIMDRNGKILVSNEMTVSFAADPKVIGNKGNAVAERFARAFGRPARFYREKLSAEGRRFVYLERRASAQYARAIETSAKEGLVAIGEPRRLYHYERIGGQVIGFTDIDNNGLSGVELSLDQYLKGTGGYVVMQRDGKGNTRPSVDYPRVEPVNGYSVVLTVDVDYQTIAEEELTRGIERTRADGGLVIMLDPSTGELLAMANYPPVNPGNLQHFTQEELRNRAITDLFEPGSVFKLVTASAALERKAVTLEQKFFAENGLWLAPLPGSRPQKIEDTHAYGTLTFQEAIERSSNIVFAKVSEKVGAEALYTMARNYGFGVETGVDLPGEVNGALKKPVDWSGTTLRTMSYGYEVGVTPIQLAAAYAALANGGVLMKPYIVQRVVDADNEPVVESHPQIVRRIISQDVARQLVRCLEGVVERGTATSAKIPGVRIAGKTGTSRKFVDGKYETGNYTASFVGFFPVESPRVVCLVMLEHPKAGGYTGGVASAPIFREIAVKALALAGRVRSTPAAPVADSASGPVVPNLVNLTVALAQQMLEARGFQGDLRGRGGVVIRQSPPAGTRLAAGAQVILTTEETIATSAGYTVVPSLRGMSIRRAINSLNARRLEVSVTGSGVVVSQSPPAGQNVKPGSRIVIRCEPRARTLLTMN
ncbi:MAG: Peptidoglycan glycosyltransferase [Bacteroidetes bacterium]|nr:Peptidoglycan glycosyltransferase [Bacteroidota bacterium]